MRIGSMYGIVSMHLEFFIGYGMLSGWQTINSVSYTFSLCKFKDIKLSELRIRMVEEKKDY